MNIDRPSTTERRHIFTVNVEDYYQVGAFKDLIQPDHWERFDTRLKINIEATLALLNETNNHATFFTSGWIAKNHPELLRTIATAGHEIACQGYHQQGVNDLPPGAFAEDLKRSKFTVEDAIGAAVNGFRIGRGWIGPADLWVLDTLQEQGFLYDSS
ncbi:MAG: polysaccharide deacetylase family protein, partial [Pseudomonadota bacterium]